MKVIAERDRAIMERAASKEEKDKLAEALQESKRDNLLIF